MWLWAAINCGLSIMAIICGLIVLAIICGLIITIVFLIGNSYVEDILDAETTHFDSLFSVAARLEKVYGGKAYVGLQIPDADTGSRQTIDMVLITKGEAVVISVQNLSGLVEIVGDGSWVSTTQHSDKVDRLPDPIAEVKRQVAILESYLGQRGSALPEGYLSYRVVCSNPDFRTIHSDYFPSEVVTYEQWLQLRPELKSSFSWIKDAFRGGEDKMQESLHQKLNFILATAPSWDRLQLKGDKNVLGEFLKFKGKHDDVQSLKDIHRAEINRLVIQQTSMFGLAHGKLQLRYFARDYRKEGAWASEWKEVTVGSSTEGWFQLQNSTKVHKFKLSSAVSLSLSA